MAGWTQKLKLHHLQMLVALGEQGNLTQVAKMMNITQPALSKWLSQFEDEVGMPLFERHSKGLRPTEGGKLLLQHAQRLINDMSRSQYEIERFKQGGQVGSLMIGCSPVATDCVSQAILELLKEMPTLHLNIEEKVMTPLLNDLLAGVIDVVVGRVGGRALELPLFRPRPAVPACPVARHAFAFVGELVARLRGVGRRWRRRGAPRCRCAPPGAAGSAAAPAPAGGRATAASSNAGRCRRTRPAARPASGRNRRIAAAQAQMPA